MVSSICAAPLPALTSAAEATGSMPRPRTARSVAFEVETSGPRSSISRCVVDADAAGGIGAAGRGDDHRMEIRLDALVAVGRRVRDVVGNRRQAGGIRGKPGNPGIERGGNGHGRAFLLHQSSLGATASARRLNSALTGKILFIASATAAGSPTRPRGSPSVRSRITSTRLLRLAIGLLDRRLAVGVAGDALHPLGRQARRLRAGRRMRPARAVDSSHTGLRASTTGCARIWPSIATPLVTCRPRGRSSAVRSRSQVGVGLSVSSSKSGAPSRVEKLDHQPLVGDLGDDVPEQPRPRPCFRRRGPAAPPRWT